MNERKEFEKNLEEKLQSWQTQIDNIKSRSDQVNPQYQIEFERQLDLLYAKHNLAREKLTRLKSAKSELWEELKRSLDGISNEIENAIDSASAKIG